MIRSMLLGCAALLLVPGVLLVGYVLLADEPPGGEPPAPFDATAVVPAANAAVEEALDRSVSADFHEQDLADLVSYLSHYGIDAYLDERAVAEAGLDSDAPLRTLHVNDVSLRSVLNLVLAPLDLTYFVRDGKLHITTQDVADMELVVMVYRVDDLAGRYTNKSGQSFVTFDDLIEVITSTVTPGSWHEFGGPGTVQGFQGTLVVSQTGRVHQEIQRLLTALRESRKTELAGAAPKPIWAERKANLSVMRQLEEKSKQPADFEFAEVPLDDVMAAVADHFGVQIVLDVRAFEEVGISEDTPVTQRLRQVTLPAALEMLLQPLSLTHRIDDEVVQITSIDVADTKMAVVVYPVADLVQPGEAKVGGKGQDFDTLIEAVTETVAPDTWDEVGGPGTINEHWITSSLVVGQTQALHGSLARLLTGLRKLRAPLPEPPEGANPKPPPKQALPAPDKISKPGGLF